MPALSAEQWNQRYPVGTPVFCRPGRLGAPAIVTLTATNAWNLGDCIPVIKVEAGQGLRMVTLSSLEPMATSPKT